jgi:hypothetical protein
MGFIVGTFGIGITLLILVVILLIMISLLYCDMQTVKKQIKRYGCRCNIRT